MAFDAADLRPARYFNLPPKNLVHAEAIEAQEAFQKACATQSYPRLILSGVRLRVGWTVLAVALACEVPQYLLLWSFFVDDSWPIPAKRDTGGLELALLYAGITACLAWLPRKGSHRGSKWIPVAACLAICTATWAPLPGPDWAAGGGFIYAIASVVLAWNTLRTQARSRHYPAEYFEPAALDAFVQLQPRSGDRARYAFRGRSVAGVRRAELVGLAFAGAWVLTLAIYAGRYYSRPKSDMDGFGEAFATIQAKFEAGDRPAISLLANSDEALRGTFYRIPRNSADRKILSYRHKHLRLLRRPNVSVYIYTAGGSLELRLEKNKDRNWRWSQFDYWP